MSTYMVKLILNQLKMFSPLKYTVKKKKKSVIRLLSSGSSWLFPSSKPYNWQEAWEIKGTVSGSSSEDWFPQGLGLGLLVWLGGPQTTNRSTVYSVWLMCRAALFKNSPHNNNINWFENILCKRESVCRNTCSQTSHVSSVRSLLTSQMKDTV